MAHIEGEKPFEYKPPSGFNQPKFAPSPRTGTLNTEQTEALAGIADYVKVSGLSNHTLAFSLSFGAAADEGFHIFQDLPEGNLAQNFLTPFEDGSPGGVLRFPGVHGLQQAGFGGGQDIIPGFGGVPEDLGFAILSGAFIPGQTPEDFAGLHIPGTDTPAKEFLQDQLAFLTDEGPIDQRFKSKPRRGRGSTILGGSLGGTTILGGNN